MRRYLLLYVIAACDSREPDARLAGEVHALVTSEQRVLAGPLARIARAKRELHGNPPGWEKTLRIAELANDGLGLPPFTQAVAPGPQWRANPATLLGMGPYAEARADALAHEHRTTELAALLADVHARYDRGIAEVAAELDDVDRRIGAPAL